MTMAYEEHNKLKELIEQFETSLEMDNSIEANTIEELADLVNNMMNDYLNEITRRNDHDS